jgi:penicillin V acylase-like amidase (Ntn superfamily)
MINQSVARRFTSVRIVLFAAALTATGLWAASSQACSEFILPPEKTIPAVVSARTLEFPGVNSEWWDVSWRAIERDRAWTSGSLLIGVGKQWTNDYGFVGLTAVDWFQKLMKEAMDALGTGPLIMDGMNEQGLSASFLWLQGASLLPFEQTTKPEEIGKRLLWFHTVDYILGKFKTVAEVKAALSDDNNTDNVLIRGLYGLDRLLALHVVVHDISGASMLIQWTNEKQHIYTKGRLDKYGVVTNEPPWPRMVQEVSKDRKATPLNEMKGIPGDHKSESRFRRLVKLREYARIRSELPEYANLNAHDAAVQDAANLINTVTVIRGTDDPYPDVGWTDNFTGPTLIRDHVRKKLFFRGYNNQSYRQIDLAKINFKQSDELWMNYLPADPNPDDPVFHVYRFSQDVTRLLAGSSLKAVAADADRQTLNVTLSISDEDLLKLPPAVQTGSMFIYAVTSSQDFFQWSGNRWTPVTDSLLTPAHTGRLATRTFKVALDGLPAGLDGRQGIKIYAGYGATSTEMFLSNRQELVHVIGAPEGDGGQ